MAFLRWSDGYPGGWDAERVVFRGEGEPQAYMVSDGDSVLIDRATVVALGDLDAILAHFDAAEFDVPALTVEKLSPGDPD